MSAAAGPPSRRLNLRLKKFDMSRIKHDKVVVLIGKRETGKSFLVKDLLWHNQDIPVGTVISGTEGANMFYSKTVPPAFVHEEAVELAIPARAPFKVAVGDLAAPFLFNVCAV